MKSSSMSLSFLLFVSACGPDGVWRRCSLYPGKNDGRAECAQTAMPRLPGGSATFVSAAKRLRASAPSRGQLWLLHGGPGMSGTIGLAGFMDEIHGFAPDLDVYTLDARGTGDSEFLECPEQQTPSSPGGAHIVASEAAACAAKLRADHPDLDAYGFTASARDLHAAIEANRRSGQPVLLWGASGGTYWARRFLQLYPDGVDGVVLDGIVAAGRNLVADQLTSVERIGRAILDQCQADQFCSSRLPDPLAAAEALWTELDQGHCPALGHTSEEIREAVKLMLFYGRFNAMVPALIARLARCADADLRVVQSTLMPLVGPSAVPHAFSEALNILLVGSELWADPRFPDDATLDAFVAQATADARVGPRNGADLVAVVRAFPRLEEPLAAAPVSTTVPVLMLNGALDPSTPADLAVGVKAELAGPHQTFVVVPRTAHGVIDSSPTTSGVDCGRRLFQKFLADPTAEVDAGCAAERLPLDFEGQAQAGAIGLTNYWDNP